MELSAFLAKKVIIYAPSKYGHFVFFFATLIQQGSPSVWRWVHSPFGPVSLITVIQSSLGCFDRSIMIWWWQHVAFFRQMIKTPTPGGAPSLTRQRFVQWFNRCWERLLSLFSPSFCLVIKSCKWQFLVRSRILRRGVACWPSPTSPLQLLIGKTHGSPSGQWLTKWWISSSILACWSIGTPPAAPADRVDIGICHSGGCAPESRNCWLVKWAPACGIINV